MRCPNPQCPDRLLFDVTGEYGPETSRCPKCGSLLVEPPRPQQPVAQPIPISEEQPGPRHQVPDDDLVLTPVMAFEYRHDAGPARGLLRSCGLFAVVTCDDYGRQNPILGAIHEAFLQVPRFQVPLAEELMDACEQGTVALEGPGPGVVCSGCGTALVAERIECGSCDPGEAPTGSGFAELQQRLRRLRATFFFGLVFMPWILLPVALIRACDLLMRLRQYPADQIPPGARARAGLIAFASLLISILISLVLYSSALVWWYRAFALFAGQPTWF